MKEAKLKNKLTHDVWIGCPNYEGDINYITRIASFHSSQRAIAYLKDEVKRTEGTSTVYGYAKSGDCMGQVASLVDGEMKLSSPMWMFEDGSGEVFMKGAIK